METQTLTATLTLIWFMIVLYQGRQHAALPPVAMKLKIHHFCEVPQQTHQNHSNFHRTQKFFHGEKLFSADVQESLGERDGKLGEEEGEEREHSMALNLISLSLTPWLSCRAHFLMSASRRVHRPLRLQ